MSSAPITWRKVGHLTASPTIETDAHEFYHLMPEGVVLVITTLSLRSLALDDAEAARNRALETVTGLVKHGVEAITQGGVPLVVTAGYEFEQRWIEDMTRACGVPFISATQPLVEALHHLSLRRLAVVAPWEEGVNALAARYFVDAGFEVQGTRTTQRTLEELHTFDLNGEARLAETLARSALTDFPDADGLLLLGPQWPTSRIVQPLEDAFGKPVVTNTHARVWKVRRLLGLTDPIPGRGRLLASV
jgi:maleate cis-trans isomerase